VSRLKSPHLLLGLAMLFWSGNWIAGRLLREDFSPLGLNFWRWTIALAIVLPFTARELWAGRRIVLRHLGVLAALGLLGISLFNMMLYAALHFTTSVNGVLIQTSQPVVIVLMAWALLREGITRRQALGIVVSLVGVLILVTRGQPGRLLGVELNAGDLWVVASVPVWSLYTILLRHSPRGLSPLALLAAMTALGVALMLPFYLYAEVYVRPQTEFHGQALMGLVYLGLFSSVLGVVFFNMGVSALGPNVAGLFVHLVPVFTTVLAWIILGETLRLYHLPGVALVFGGIVLTTRGGPRPLREGP